MIRAFAVFAAVFLLSAPGAGTSLAAGVPETGAERGRHEAALRELREKVEALRQELAESSDEKADAAELLRESERAISDAGRALGELAVRQMSLQQQLTAQQAKLAALAREQAGHRQALARLLVAQHRRRPQEPLRILLQGGGPDDVRRQLVYLRTLNGARFNAIAEAHRRAERAAALRAETETLLAGLDQVVRAGRAQRTVLERERKTRQATLARIGNQLEVRRRQLVVAQRDEARLARLVARLGALFDAEGRASPPAAGPASQGSAANAGDVAAALARFRGLLKFPAAGELISRFGVRRQGSESASKGWFIRAPAGTAVQAVASGRVVFADWLRGFGNLVILDHGDGFMSLYGNNDALLQQVGVTIEAGQAVAQAGSSGGAAESGVYFELRHNGVVVDPTEWFGRQ